MYHVLSVIYSTIKHLPFICLEIKNEILLKGLKISRDRDYLVKWLKWRVAIPDKNSLVPMILFNVIIKMFGYNKYPLSIKEHGIA